MINYAEKFISKVDEAFTLLSFTEPAVNKDFDFTGVNVVHIFDVPTVPLNNYTISGINRYGTPDELQNNVQDFIISQDKSFTFTIDKRVELSTMGTMNAGVALAREIREQIIPEVDIYRLEIITANAGNTTTNGAVTKTNAYSLFLDGTAQLTDNKVPYSGRIAFVSTNFFKLIKQDNSFIKSGDMSQRITLNGEVGMIDGIPIIVVPTSYLPANVEFIITHPIAATAVLKIEDFKIHDNPQGINGTLIEGRVLYDLFVLNNKKSAIYVYNSTV